MYVTSDMFSPNKVRDYVINTVVTKVSNGAICNECVYTYIPIRCFELI